MMENGSSVANFDLSSECPNNYFKSSFARSMAFGNTAQSKSLDYVYMDEGSTINEESEPPGEVPAAKPPPEPQRKPPFTPRRSVPTIPTYELQREFSLRASRNRSNDAIKFWKMKQESIKSSTVDGGPHWSETRDNHQEQSKDEEINKLRKVLRGGPLLTATDRRSETRRVSLEGDGRRSSPTSPRQEISRPGKSGQITCEEQKECQGLMEANRKLQQASASIDHSLLQAQVDTLQWQLKQAESNRQMYKAVMEQVSKFLERVHKTLEASCKSQSSRSKARSRSVHTVAQSRASSPSGSVHRASSISQIQDSYSAFRDYACRSSRAVTVEELAPERLSQEAFRLLRTVQSLLGTREPDLARVSASDTETTERRDSTSMGSCSSLLQSSCSREQEDSKVGGPATPQLSVGSTEDESGFSSMSSFHEVGLPSSNGVGGGSGEGSFHELGLPVVEGNGRHRRWSSTPVDRPPDYHPQREALRVLWCSSRIQEGAPNCAYKMKKFMQISRTAYSNDGFKDFA